MRIAKERGWKPSAVFLALESTSYQPLELWSGGGREEERE